jgi:dethiobiotin synthetase
LANGVFITATDRDIGKTLIATGIGLMLQKRNVSVTAFKPVYNGGLVSQDAKFFVQHLNLTDSVDDISPYCFENNVVPVIASRMEKRDIDVRKIQTIFARFQQERKFVIAETVGGVMTPLRNNLLNKDLIKLLGLPVIVVTRAAFGTINHTLMTLKVLKQEGIRVDGIIINEFNKFGNGLAETTNPEVIAEFSEGIPILAVVDWKSAYHENFAKLAADLEQQPKLVQFVNAISQRLALPAMR